LRELFERRAVLIRDLEATTEVVSPSMTGKLAGKGGAISACQHAGLGRFVVNDRNRPDFRYWRESDMPKRELFGRLRRQTEHWADVAG
jgi:hypothetical protein